MENVLKKNYLFWDVANVNPQENWEFIIERILLYGDKDDFFWAKNFYGEEKLKQVFLRSRTLDKKSISFWRQYFGVEKTYVPRIN